jgi:hypothetical protein
MTVTGAELASLATAHDILGIGMLADEVRRTRHGVRTTFVRVADVAAEPSEEVSILPAAGEIRIVGAPGTRSAAIDRVSQILASAGPVPVSAFSLADLEELAVREHVTLRSLLEELRAGGLEIIAEAPFDRLRDARRAIEEVNIAGLALARLTIDRLPASDTPSLL